MLSLDTVGQSDECRRQREFLRRRFGFTHELRVVFLNRGASWGALALYPGGSACRQHRQRVYKARHRPVTDHSPASHGRAVPPRARGERPARPGASTYGCAGRWGSPSTRPGTCCSVVTFRDAAGTQTITVELAVTWRDCTEDVQPFHGAHRLGPSAGSPAGWPASSGPPTLHLRAGSPAAWSGARPTATPHSRPPPCCSRRGSCGRPATRRSSVVSPARA